MSQLEPQQVTQFLMKIEEGDSQAFGELLPHVYEDLRRMAEQAFRNQWREHTLQPTALVHEAYMKLAKPGGGGWESRKHFMAVAAMAMGQLLNDYAVSRNTRKRGGDRHRVLLEEAEATSETDGVDLVALNDALTRLKLLDERQGKIVELRFLAGLTVEETADVLNVSERTVYLDWNMARAWLEMELKES